MCSNLVISFYDVHLWTLNIKLVSSTKGLIVAWLSHLYLLNTIRLFRMLCHIDNMCCKIMQSSQKVIGNWQYLLLLRYQGNLKKERKKGHLFHFWLVEIEYYCENMKKEKKHKKQQYISWLHRIFNDVFLKNIFILGWRDFLINIWLIWKQG